MPCRRRGKYGSVKKSADRARQDETDHPGSLGYQGLGSQVRLVASFLDDGFNPLADVITYIRLLVDDTGDGGSGNTAEAGDLFEREM